MRRLALLLLFAAACSSESPSPQPATPAPVPAATPTTPATGPELPAATALVTDLYAAHAADQSPFFQTTDRSIVDHYFEPELAELIWKDAVTASGEVGALDFDPLHGGQDSDITNFAIQPAQADGTNARVVASFVNFGKSEQVVFTLAPADETWKIIRILYPDGRTLRDAFRAALVPPE